MTVYVDEILMWPTKIRCFRDGSCHMSADTLGELHAMAAKIGMRRAWFQDHPSLPHYDLTPKRREAALAAGAVFIPGREQAAKRLAERRCSCGARKSPRRSTTNDGTVTRWVCLRCENEELGRLARSVGK
jgi:hypothetical protein